MNDGADNDEDNDDNNTCACWLPWRNIPQLRTRFCADRHVYHGHGVCCATKYHGAVCNLIMCHLSRVS